MMVTVPGKGGLATLFVDGEQVAEGRIDKTQPAVFQINFKF